MSCYWRDAFGNAVTPALVRMQMTCKMPEMWQLRRKKKSEDMEIDNEWTVPTMYFCSIVVYQTTFCLRLACRGAAGMNLPRPVQLEHSRVRPAKLTNLKLPLGAHRDHGMMRCRLRAAWN